jgi:hypothetical protein
MKLMESKTGLMEDREIVSEADCLVARKPREGI